MKTIPVVRSTAYRVVVDALLEMGVPVESYLGELGVPLGALDEQDRLLPERQLRLLMDTVRARERIDDVGFQVGARHRVTDLMNIGPLLADQPTLHRAMLAFCGQLHSHSNTWDFWVEPWEGGVRLCRRGTPMDVGRWTLEQYAVAYLVDLVRLAAPAHWWPAEIWLEYPGPLTPTERRALGRAALHLGGPLTALLVPHELLGRRPRIDDWTLPAFETEPIAAEIAPVLRELIRSSLLAGRPTLESLGGALSLEPRTLQRRLAAEGTSYRDVLNDVRFDLARARLEEGRQTIAEIAAELGYGETAAFTKAFHRWAGMAPSTYRKTHGVAP